MFGRDRSKGMVQAIEDARRAVREDPDDTRALYKLGDLYNKAGQADKALETYLQVGRRYAEEAAHSKAIAVFKQALKLDPENPHIHRGIGGSCAALNRISEFQEAYLTASQILERTGRTGDAVEALKEALDHLEGSATLWARLGALHAVRNEKAEAVLAYEEALQIAEANEQWHDCLVLAEHLLTVSPEHLGAFRLAAFAALERRDPMRALGWLRRAFRIHRHDDVILEMMADAFAQIGQTQKTITLLEELAAKHMEAGDKDLAREFYERILRYDPHHADTKRALLTLATVDADWGEDLGVEWEVEGEDAALHTDDTYESVPTIHFGQPDHSVFNTNMFPAASTTSPEADDFAELYSQAETCYKYELYDRTAEILQQILTQQPSHLQARQLHARLLAQQGSVEEAASIWFALANETHSTHEAQTYLHELMAIEGVSRDFRSLARNMLRQYQQAPPTSPHGV